MKQTAVEWIEGYLLEYNDISNDLRMRKAFEYAKSMEKKQIINATLHGFRKDSDGDDWEGDNHNAEQYYKETFKQ
jgi:hypothetical protein